MSIADAIRPRACARAATRGFSLLEVMLALAIVALVMAAIGPALIGVLRAQRQVRTLVEPLVGEQAALALLRNDLLAAPRPNGTRCEPLTVVGGQVDGQRGDTLRLTVASGPPLHPRVAARPAESGQAVVTWSTRPSADQRGLAWTRTRAPHLLATGQAPLPVEAVLLDHLALLSIEAYAGGGWVAEYDSSRTDASLPLALRIGYAYLLPDGSAGPLHSVVIDLPQVALDPTQQGGGS